MRFALPSSTKWATDKMYAPSTRYVTFSALTDIGGSSSKIAGMIHEYAFETQPACSFFVSHAIAPHHLGHFHR